MSLVPFHLNCPFSHVEICRCNRYLSSKKEVNNQAEIARKIYQLYVRSDPEYEKEFGLGDESTLGPFITYRVVVDGKTAGLRDPQSVFQGPPLPVPHQRSIPNTPQNNNMQQATLPTASPQVNTPQNNQQPWARFANPITRTPTIPMQIQHSPQVTPSRPALPQPTQPRTPFNNSNIKIVSSTGASISTPAPPTVNTQITPSNDGTPRTLNKKRNRVNNATSPTPSSSEPKKRGRPRKRRVCERCDEGEQTAQEYGKDKSILQCVNCKTCIHTFCHEPTLDHVPVEFRKTWRCEDCKICETCVESGDEEQILICEVCDRGFHTYCLQPPLEQIPKGSWMCQECKQPRQQIRYVQPSAQMNYGNVFMNQYAQMQQMYGQQMAMGAQHAPQVMHPFEMQLQEEQDENGAKRIKYN